MLNLQLSNLGRGAVQASLILAVSIIAATVSVATVTHKTVMRTAALSHQIDPIDPTCTSSLPCIEYQNNGTGYGIEGIGKTHAGVFGETLFNSTSASNIANGVAGQDASTSGSFNSGVRGTSTRGTGVSGSSTNGTGVLGETSFASSTATVGKAGVEGIDLGTNPNADPNYGVLGTSRNGLSGVQGDGISTFGVTGTTQFPSKSILPTIGGIGGLEGDDNSTDGGNGDFGVVGFSPNGLGIFGLSDVAGVEGKPTMAKRIYIPNPAGGFIQTGIIGVGRYGIAAFGNDTAASNNPALYVQDMNGGVLIRAGGPSTDVLSVDATGNMILSGNLTVDGSISQGGSTVTTCSPCPQPLVVHRAADGSRVGTFTTQQSMPSMEDFGQGQLIGGHGYVRIDSAFANVIDARTQYLVFITPEGDNRGLYVTQKTSSGFAVRESQSGHSSLVFDYRIVAKPMDAQLQRLPHVAGAHLSAGVHTGGTTAAQFTKARTGKLLF